MTTIRIDNAWLNLRGNGPYLLDQLGTTYELATDLVVDGTPFVFGAANITLDLCGHIITYANADIGRLLNGGFEDGANGWDLKGAPGAAVRPARFGMWGGSMLTLPGFTTPQRIISPAFKITLPGREHVATITPKGTSGTVLMLSVIDAKTGAVLKSGKADSVGSGFGATVKFVPATAGDIFLQIDITPPTGEEGTIDLDYADVFLSGDCGIVATGTTTSLPAHLKTTAITKAIQNASSATIVNGTIRQGISRSYGGSAINGSAMRGSLHLENVATFVNGMDSLNIAAAYAESPTIAACKCDAAIENISNRKDVFGAINCTSNSGKVAVRDCQIVNCPQSGIVASKNQPDGSIEITGNTISQRGIISNAYGIILNGITNGVVSGNNVRTSAGRGISLDSWQSASTHDLKITDNEVDCRVQPNLEYTEKFMESVAFRMRNYDGEHRNVYVARNKFTARCGDGDGLVATALRIAQQNNLGQMANAGNVFEANSFCAIVETTDRRYHAAGVTISGVDAGTGLVFRGNAMSSNDTALQIGDDAYYKEFNEGVVFESTGLGRSPLGDQTREYIPILAGDQQSQCRDIRLVNTNFGNDKADPVFRGTGLKQLTFTTNWTTVMTQSGKLPPVMTTYTSA